MNRRTLVTGLALIAAGLMAPQNVVIVNMPSTAGTTQTLLNVTTGDALPLNATTLYSSLVGNGTGDVSWRTTIESTRGTLLPAGTLNALRFTTSYDTPLFDIGDAGDTLTATVMKNGIATSLTCRVTGITGAANKEEQCATVPFVVSPPVTVVQGDRFTLRITTTGTPSVNGMATWAIDFTPALPNTTVMAGMHSSLTPARWLPPGVSSHGTGGSSSGANDTEGRVYVPIAGRISGILCRSNVTRAVSTKVEVIINGNRHAALDCVVANANGANPVAVAATRAVAAGDTISLRYAGDSGAGYLFATLLFEPTMTGKWWTGFSSGPTVAFSGVNLQAPLTGYRMTYCPRNHACSFWPPPNLNIDAMRVDIGTVPTGSQRLQVFVARHIEDPPPTDSTIASNLSCLFSAGSWSNCIDLDSVSVNAVNANDYWEIVMVPTNNPNATTVKVSTVFSRD